MRERVRKITIIILIIIEIISISLGYNSFLNRKIKLEEVTLIKENKDMYAFYVENDNGGYEESEDDEWPTEGYKFNDSKSGCVDEQGNKIEGILSYVNNEARVRTKKAAYCYIYFDKVRYLYNILKDEATKTGGYAKLYSGQHQDDFNGTRSTENIYHWYGQTTADGNEIVNKNNIVFAGLCWQMIRTTDIGGVKLLYNGEPIVTTTNGVTTYDCGTNRPSRIGEVLSTTSLQGTFYYASSYTKSVSGNTTTFTLDNPVPVTINASNAASAINDISANYPYTCKKANSGDTCNNATFYKVESQSSGVNANVYLSTYRDAIGVLGSAFGVGGGYMYNLDYQPGSNVLSKTQAIGNNTYLIGEGIQKNNDDTFSLTGTVLEVSSSNWSSIYGNMTNKFVCLPGYYTYDSNTGTNSCYDSRTINNVSAIGYTTATTTTNFSYYPMYKYGFGIEQDNGTLYKLVSNGNEAGTLQYIYDWTNAGTTTPAVNEISTSGYSSITKSHYTCQNLSGKCSSYRYVTGGATGSTYNYFITNLIPGGKYVSTDVTDPNNILYMMLNEPNVNTNESSIKVKIEGWYQTKLYSNYDNYIDDTVFCNNRVFDSYAFFDPNGGSQSTNAMFKGGTTSTDLSCAYVTDKFSVSNASARLTYKVGLITPQEMRLLNVNNARQGAYQFWLFGPNCFTANSLRNSVMNTAGGIGNSLNGGSNAIRPAISLVKGIEYTRGTGKTDDPYVVE